MWGQLAERAVGAAADRSTHSHALARTDGYADSSSNGASHRSPNSNAHGRTPRLLRWRGRTERSHRALQGWRLVVIAE